MPPRYAVAPEASPSPPPENDAQDILVIQDIMDTLDQIPPELTRVHSDLNELGAVLYSTLVNLETKLNQLIDWIQDPTVEPAKRFQLLQEIAEEAARYKLGGDDKIRVAGGACDGIMAHQRHISNLLAASTLLVQAPLSPYTQSLTLQQQPVYQSSRRQVARAVNSPFGGPVGRAAPTTTGTGDTPTKKKKNRMQALGLDDDVSSAAGEKRKTAIKKRKPANRAASPADSLASASAFTSNKPSQPQTARQLAAAANKAKKAERADDSDEESDDEDNAGGLGLDVGSREGSQMGARSVNDTPVLSNAGHVQPTNGRRAGNGRGIKRSRLDEEDDGDSELDEEDGRPIAKRGLPKKETQVPHYYEMDNGDAEGGGDGELDSRVYCTCRQVSYGEMIGCDDDDCEIEWYHIACIGLDRTPAGTWICPQCTERRKRAGPKKRTGKPKPKK